MQTIIRKGMKHFSRYLVYPFHEALVHRPTFSYLKELEKTQWLSRDELEKYQMDKLKALLVLAHDHCPWHRERIRQAGLALDQKKNPYTVRF